MSASLPPSAEPTGSGHRLPLATRSVRSLDWELVLEALAERASTFVGQRRCAALPFLDEPEDARLALARLSEMIELRADGRAPGFGGIEDIGPQLRAASKGEILPGSELVRVASSLDGLARLHGHLADEAERAERLYAVAASIKPLPDLASWLSASFDGRGELSAATYPQLTSLRGRKAKIHAKIRETLDNLRGEDRFDDSLMDDFTGMRNDRYVLPVKSQHKNQGLGIVHGTSGSGQTVFVEPWEVVEENNNLKLADAELQQEERRILRDLTERVALVAPAVVRSLESAARLDIISAKSKLAEDLGATVPTVVEEPFISLKEARHPALVLQGIDVVANDLSLGRGKRALVISGPNTGGKTIALKTLGLAALMVRSGMAVPAEEGSRVGWFDRVLTDIGDLQGVQEGLSTFSAHVLSLVEILADVDSKAGAVLVLIDEIAAGTDPVQGAALGRAILSGLLDRDVVLATTTHFSELKALSTTDERFTSARVEFDPDAGRPTYRLTVGRPGSSHAIDVAARVGLPADILALARELLDPTAASVEGMLSGLEGEVARAREAKEAALADRAAAAAELAEVRSERDALRRRQREIEKIVKTAFDKEVRGYRDSVRGALKQMRDAQSQAAAERARERISSGANTARERLADWGVDVPAVDALDPATVKVGDRVRVASLGKDVTVVEPVDKKGRLTVDVGGMRVQVAGSDLERSRSAAPKPKKKPKPQQRPRQVQSVSTETPDTAARGETNTVDLRGKTIDEATSMTEQRLDDAAMAGESFVFLLHGHGTGALKKALRQWLKRSSYVECFEPGQRHQGGDGITVVQLSR
jgi:DNA mismatch repair protein MutS2